MFRALLISAAMAGAIAASPTAAAMPEQRGPLTGQGFFVESCSDSEYQNSDGQCIPRPNQSQGVPQGATAQCRDGTYSFSTHRQGTCSGHGGVSQWLSS